MLHAELWALCSDSLKVTGTLQSELRRVMSIMNEMA